MGSAIACHTEARPVCKRHLPYVSTNCCLLFLHQIDCLLFLHQIDHTQLQVHAASGVAVTHICRQGRSKVALKKDVWTFTIEIRRNHANVRNERDCVLSQRLGWIRCLQKTAPWEDHKPRTRRYASCSHSVAAPEPHLQELDSDAFHKHIMTNAHTNSRTPGK